MYEGQEVCWKHLTYQFRDLHLNEQSMEANTSPSLSKHILRGAISGPHSNQIAAAPKFHLIEIMEHLCPLSQGGENSFPRANKGIESERHHNQTKGMG